MADAAKISGKQMKRLQTLWGIFVKSGFASTNPEPRAARLLWVGETIGRQIGSFKDLSAAEAKTAIDAIQKHLPAELLTRSSSRRALPARPGRETAQAYGTSGRSRLAGANAGGAVRMADAGTLQLLANLCTALGWTRERLDAFLRSSKSPVRSGRVRTLAEANRVIWILKGMRRRAEKAKETAGINTENTESAEDTEKRAHPEQVEAR